MIKNDHLLGDPGVLNRTVLVDSDFPQPVRKQTSESSDYYYCYSSSSSSPSSFYGNHHHHHHHHYYYSMKHQLTSSDYFITYSLLVAFSSHARQKRNMQDFKCQNGTLTSGVFKSPSKPILTVEAKGPTKTRLEGHDALFDCIVHSSLPANITWFHDGKSLINDSRHRYLHCNTSLQLQSMTSKDAGKYSCVVNSALGNATASFRLDVICK